MAWRYMRTADGQNRELDLSACLNGLPGCNVSQLTPSKSKASPTRLKTKEPQQLHLIGLSKGDPTRLTTEQAKTVGVMYTRRNAKSCIDGLAGCDPQRLNAADTALMAETARKRNVDRCMRSVPSCEPLDLRPEEAALVAKMDSRRNYDACMKGLSTCDPLRLNKQELAAAQNEGGQAEPGKLYAGGEPIALHLNLSRGGIGAHEGRGQAAEFYQLYARLLELRSIYPDKGGGRNNSL